ncbi:MAG: AAA family ATPase [Hassallia sp. WJT32-NPBG1]|jgi:replicative DNA helicase|nr:AAA family ATPase [Hassallia sp. WJT32-NPBG1]
MNMTASLSFDSYHDTLPPFESEAEESILGGILLDPSAIGRVKDKLKPEHFFFPSHQDIYQACLILAENGTKTDILCVESYLKANNLIEKVGGVNKTRKLFHSCVSAVNIDALADLVVDKAVRRAVIKLGAEIQTLGFAVNEDLAEIIAALERQVRLVTEASKAPTKEDAQRAKHDRLIKQLTDVYTTCGEPSYRYYKLKELADEHKVSIKFLETLYLKSLASQCSSLLSYEELKERAGGNIREWLVNGLVPKRTTICLVADGGIGKTKYAYSLGKLLIEGNPFGVFHPTGEKRKILYYQGDEPDVDMYQALETLGYSEGDIGTYVKVRLGWSFENMPNLIQDLQDFNPDFVIVDSLTSANRLSTFRESEMEYARPLIELAGLATNYDCSFLVIHHTNKGGDVRGTTAIRNSVSEFWKLSKPTDATSNSSDRLLEIDKSRSRSSGKKYRLHFDPDNLNFTFLGEEGAESSNSSSSLKQQILKFFAANRKVYFTAVEISHELDSDRGYTRKCLAELKADGLLNAIQTLGFATKYFLDYDGDYQGAHEGTPHVHPPAPLQNLVSVSFSQNTEGGAPHSPEKIIFEGAATQEKNIREEGTPPPNLEEPSNSNGLEGVQGVHIENDLNQENAHLDGETVGNNTAVENEPKSQPNEPKSQPTAPITEAQVTPATPKEENFCPKTGLPLPKPFTIEVDSPIGVSTAAVRFTKVQNDHKVAFSVDFNFANGTKNRKHGSISKGKAEIIEVVEKEIKKVITKAIKHPSKRYKVQQILGSIQKPEVRWVGGCQCVEIPDAPLSDWWVFQSPDGEYLQVAGDKEFQLEKS